MVDVSIETDLVRSGCKERILCGLIDLFCGRTAIRRVTYGDVSSEAGCNRYGDCEWKGWSRSQARARRRAAEGRCIGPEPDPDARPALPDSTLAIRGVRIWLNADRDDFPRCALAKAQSYVSVVADLRNAGNDPEDLR